MRSFIILFRISLINFEMSYVFVHDDFGNLKAACNWQSHNVNLLSNTPCLKLEF